MPASRTLACIVIRMFACRKPGTRKANKPSDYPTHQKKDEGRENTASYPNQSTNDTTCKVCWITRNIVQEKAECIDNRPSNKTCEKAQPTQNCNFASYKTSNKANKHTY